MKKELVEVVRQDDLGDNIYSLYIRNKEISLEAHAGQFISLFTNDFSRLLPRPISICDIDKKSGIIRMVYRIAGGGTKEFSLLKASDKIEIIGPLGNGYSVDAVHPIILGGGIGIPPMLELTKEFFEKGISKNDISVVLGYRNEPFLLNEFQKISTVYITSDSGNCGIKGNVIDGLNDYDISGDVIYACGPKPMLKGVKAYSEEKNMPAYISLEEHMACGIGACLGCVVDSKNIDDHSKVKNKRICKDGPVFLAEEVILW